MFIGPDRTYEHEEEEEEELCRDTVWFETELFTFYLTFILCRRDQVSPG